MNDIINIEWIYEDHRSNRHGICCLSFEAFLLCDWICIGDKFVAHLTPSYPDEHAARLALAEVAQDWRKIDDGGCDD